MYIYTCTLELLEHTFFSSREINAFFQTEALIGNYALCYALGLCQTPYYNDGTIWYKPHLSQLNARGIYVTPAKIEGKPAFTITQFNAQTDTYWYKFDQNAITVNKHKKARAINYPQTGKIKMLAFGNILTFYVLSTQPIDGEIPRYIRLGKFMSKARVSSKRQTCEPGQTKTAFINAVLNPVDLPETLHLQRFDLCNIHPSTFLRNAEATGVFYQLPGNVFLPANMRFGVDAL
jgi:CRISPR-associated protein Csc1